LLVGTILLRIMLVRTSQLQLTGAEEAVAGDQKSNSARELLELGGAEGI
jgi:hypothetical protein